MNEVSLPSGWTATSNMRVEPRKGLDDFPTPPWATRALMEMVSLQDCSVWEPACGRGTMAVPLAEQAELVIRSDIVDYGIGAQVIDFLNTGWNFKTDWIVTNPPFNLAVPFTLKALSLARAGVAMLARSNWIETVNRYDVLFKPHPPTFIMPFCERVPMVKGCYDPGAGTATSYSWYVWMQPWGYSLLDTRSVDQARSQASAVPRERPRLRAAEGAVAVGNPQAPEKGPEGETRCSIVEAS
jgi:hypothetical protein